MPPTTLPILAVTALFWAFVYIWFEAGFVAVLALAAVIDLAITALGHRRARTRPVDIRRRKGS